MCTILSSAAVQVGPSTYYANKTRPPCARACRDALLGPAALGRQLPTTRSTARKGVRTIKPDRYPAPSRPGPSHFTATAPNQLWVTDLTFVPTFRGAQPIQRLSHQRLELASITAMRLNTATELIRRTLFEPSDSSTDPTRLRRTARRCKSARFRRVAAPEGAGCRPLFRR
jgi:transposase InsO family protein